MSLGKKLKTARYIKNYTQEFMAQTLNISQKTYSNFESDKSIPSLKQLELISETLDTNLLEFLQLDSVSITNHGGTNQHAVVFNNYPENLIKQYECRIEDLQKEIEHLKNVIEKILR